MKSWMYYGLSALLLLATLPMYRYIFQRSAELSQVPLAAVPAAPAFRSVIHHTAASRQPVQLLKGAICEGGFVYFVEGSTHTNLLLSHAT